MGFHGQILRQQLTSPFRVTETLFIGDQELPWHRHETAYVSFLLAGAYLERTRRADNLCSMGTVIWHAPGETHRDCFGKLGGHLLNLEFHKPWLQSIGAEVDLPQKSRSCRGGLSYLLGLNIFHFLNTGIDVPEHLAMELLSLNASCRDDKKQPPWLHRTVEFIHDLHCERLTLNTVAGVAGVHPVHVCRTFHRVFGCTFGAYLSQTGLRRAFDLLQGSSKPLVDVALECGFADQAHMCRKFKRCTGITPSAYRKLVRG